MCAEKSNVCRGGPKLIFACSGAADVGEIADRAARELTKNGLGKMFCLAGIGGRVGGIMKKTSRLRTSWQSTAASLTAQRTVWSRPDSPGSNT